MIRLAILLRQRGFTVIEIMLALAILSVIAVIALPSYFEYVERAKVATAITDITSIELDIERYFVLRGDYPESLSAITSMNDPWGNPYQYLKLGDKSSKGKARKDHALVPINSDYDLYSMGADGQSQPPLTSKTSKDDIVRANNGTYVGPAENY